MSPFITQVLQVLLFSAVCRHLVLLLLPFPTFRCSMSLRSQTIFSSEPISPNTPPFQVCRRRSLPLDGAHAKRRGIPPDEQSLRRLFTIGYKNSMKIVEKIPTSVIAVSTTAFRGEINQSPATISIIIIIICHQAVAETNKELFILTPAKRVSTKNDAGPVRPLAASHLFRLLRKKEYIFCACL